ncbi:MAG: hypothetical protein M1822_010047 [Bathelium mastoideum]|nr:MAG: hypothetical protein M1822_010047 [Bathelium mastoideum]
MVRSASIAALEELRNPTSPTGQIAALKHVKNEITGHDQRKAVTIKQGLVLSLVQLLETSAKAGGKRRTQEVNGHSDKPSIHSEWSDEDELRLQALMIAESLAQGGPAMVSPLVNAGILSLLFECTNPRRNPSRVRVAALRTLIAVAGTIQLIPDFPYQTEQYPAAQELTAALTSRDAVDALGEILSLSGHPREVSLAVQLIAKTCQREGYQSVLVKSGVLDLLSSRLAALIIYLGYILPGVDAPVVANLPSPPPKSDLGLYLEAIRGIVDGSKYRTARFLYSSSIVAVFPTYRPQPPPPSAGPLLSGLSTQMPTNPLERLLPQIPSPQRKGENGFSRAFPNYGNHFGSPRDASRASPERPFSSDDLDSPMFAWLLHIARSEEGLTRITALWLLKSVSGVLGSNSLDPRISTSNGNRERVLAFLGVPILVKMIDHNSSPYLLPTSSTDHVFSNSAWQEKILIQERAPFALQALVDGSQILQTAAQEAGVIKKLAQLLKASFNPIAPPKPMWSSEPESMLKGDAGLTGSTSLGLPGLSPRQLHAERCREGALRALGAMAGLVEEHRKEVAKTAITPFLIDSLKPYSHVGAPVSGAAFNRSGNPVKVVLAACYAARTLARSITVLRTNLTDAGIGRPVYELLSHPVLEVKLSATDVIINLSAPGSPMQDSDHSTSNNNNVSSNKEMDTLVQSGTLDRLVEHARSSNPTLRYLSLWALKHVILKSPFEGKTKCLNNFGTGLLVQILTGDDQGGQNQSPAASMGVSNAAGEQVDLLNAVEQSMEMDDSDEDEQEDEDTMTDDMGTLSKPSNLRSTSNNLHKSRLKAIKNAEQNPIILARRDDLQIQEQALDFLRNLINGTTCPDMIEHVYQNIGSARIFDILISKLRPRASATSSNNSNNNNLSAPNPRRTPLGVPTTQPSPSITSNGAPLLYQPPEIINATILVLVHLAAGLPRHRQQVIAQKNLLQAVLPHFGHATSAVRANCVQLVSNLLWVEDSGDQMAARNRAHELRYAGIEDRMRALEQDVVADVREKAKLAAGQIRDLVDGTPGYRNVPRTAEMRE